MSIDVYTIFIKFRVGSIVRGPFAEAHVTVKQDIIESFNCQQCDAD